MSGSRINTYCLHGANNIIDLKLDLLSLSHPSELAQRVQDLLKKSDKSEVRADHLLFIYADVVTPATYLTVLDDQDLMLVQQDAVQKRYSSVNFLYSPGYTGQRIRALDFFKKSEEPMPVPEIILEEAKEIIEVPVVQPIVQNLFETRFTLGLEPAKPRPEPSLKLHDFLILTEPFIPEPEYLLLGSQVIRVWKIQILGNAWQRASLVCIKGKNVGVRTQLQTIDDTIEIQVESLLDSESLSEIYRLDLDGELCGPLLWLEARLKKELTVQQQLVALGAKSEELPKLMELYDVGLTDVKKLMNTWNASMIKRPEYVADAYYS